MTNKKGKPRKGVKKKDTEKLAVRGASNRKERDIMRSFDEGFEAFRRNIRRSLWLSPSRIGSILPTWSDYYWPMLEWAETRQPLMDIKDTGKGLVVEVEMPGIPKENIDVQLTENSIQICGEVRSEEEEDTDEFYRQERSYSTCYRQVPLPAEVIPSKADASLEDGVLYVKLPKKKPTPKEKAHSVKIK